MDSSDFLREGFFEILISFPQVTVQYRQVRGAMVPLRVHTIVISVQHNEEVSLEEMRQSLKEQVVEAVVPRRYLDDETVYHLQPSGRFVIGGPQVSKEAALFFTNITKSLTLSAGVVVLFRGTLV